MNIKTSESIFLQKGLKVTDDEKSRCLEENLSSEKIKISNPKDINVIIYESAEIYYNEFIFNNYNKHIKLFFDIDIKETNKLEEDYILDIKSFIKIILSYILDIIDKNKYNVFNCIKKDIKRYLYKNITITRTSDIDKTSYHIFFNYVYFSIDILNYLKKDIQVLKSKYDNELLKNVDTNVYKKNTKLRTIFSMKENDKSVHLPINKYNSDDILMYLFSYIDTTKSHVVFEKKQIDVEEINNDIDNEIRDKCLNIVSLKYLQGYKVVHEWTMY